jgi:hypothetical protein
MSGVVSNGGVDDAALRHAVLTVGIGMYIAGRVGALLP